MQITETRAGAEELALGHPGVLAISAATAGAAYWDGVARDAQKVERGDVYRRPRTRLRPVPSGAIGPFLMPQ
jgi:hypothetical protein